jgi:hypothetical protein
MRGIASIFYCDFDLATTKPLSEQFNLHPQASWKLDLVCDQPALLDHLLIVWTSLELVPKHGILPIERNAIKRRLLNLKLVVDTSILNLFQDQLKKSSLSHSLALSLLSFVRVQIINGKRIGIIYVRFP